MSKRKSVERYDQVILSSGRPAAEETVHSFALLHGAHAVARALDGIQDFEQDRELAEGLILAIRALLSLAVERADPTFKTMDALDRALAADRANDLADLAADQASG